GLDVPLTCTNVTDVDFVNKEALMCLSGYKLDENNGPQSGWLITVEDADGVVVGTDTTDAAGYWEVCDLIQGVYNVSETMQTGWVAVDPADGNQDATLVDQSVGDVNFTNRRSLCLSGYKLDENNGPQSGWLITVEDADGVVVGSDTTDAAGYWEVCDLIQGVYNVSETMQTGWVAVTPADGDQDATLVDQSVGDVNFTNRRSLCLSGYKLDENNGPQSGWLITVEDADGVVVGTDTTDAAGYWEVCDLIQGVYNVSETMQTGWVAVDPADGNQDATLVDQSVGDVNFTNRRSLCLSGYKLDENNGPQSGWLITVEDADGVVVGSDTTDAAGYWEVCDLIQGVYNVSETMQTGWVAVTPADGDQDATLVDQSVGDVNFTNRRSLCL